MFVGGLGALAPAGRQARARPTAPSASSVCWWCCSVSGRPRRRSPASSMLTAHALFKAALFLIVGIIDHQAHTRDLRRLQGLTGRLPVIAGAAFLAAASMAAVPPTFGFVAKEAATRRPDRRRRRTWRRHRAGRGRVGRGPDGGVHRRALDVVRFDRRLPARSMASPGSTPPRSSSLAGLRLPPVLLAALSLRVRVCWRPLVGHFFADVAASSTQVPEDTSCRCGPGSTAALPCRWSILALGAVVSVFVVRRESGRQAPAGRGERAYATTYDELCSAAPAGDPLHPERLVAGLSRHRVHHPARDRGRRASLIDGIGSSPAGRWAT